jgi:hypothetical protein
MLVPAARNNLEKWATPASLSKPLSVTYNFRFREDTTTPAIRRFVETDEPIGNGFDRFLLRLFHRPVTRRVKREVFCGTEDSPAEFKIGTRDDLPTVDINVEAGWECLQPSTTYALR